MNSPNMQLYHITSIFFNLTVEMSLPPLPHRFPLGIKSVTVHTHAFEVGAFLVINVHAMLLQLNDKVLPLLFFHFSCHHTTNAYMVKTIKWFLASVAILLVLSFPYDFIKHLNIY
jgi:hypothetical protein